MANTSSETSKLHDKPTTDKVTKVDDVTYKTKQEFWHHEMNRVVIADVNPEKNLAEGLLCDDLIVHLGGRGVLLEIKLPALGNHLKAILPNRAWTVLEPGRPTIVRDVLFFYLDALRTRRQFVPFPSPELDRLISYMDGVYRDTQDRLRESMKHAYIAHDLLWAIYKPDSILITICPVANAWKAVRFVSGKYGSNAFKLQCRFRDFKEDKLGEASLELQIPAFDGQKPIVDLEYLPLQYHPKALNIRGDLLRRGAKFLALRGIHHKYFSGVAKPMLTGDPDILMEGKIMVDPAQYYTDYSYPHPFEADHRTYGTPSIYLDHPHQFERLEVKKGSEFDDLDNEYVYVCALNGTPDDIPGTLISTQESAQDGAIDGTPEETQLLLYPPAIIGYALEGGNWCKFPVDDIHHIDHSMEPLDRLIVDDELKRKLLAHAKWPIQPWSSHDPEDCTEAKKIGVNILLYGPSGVGKTHTVEVIAEQLKLPLLPVGLIFRYCLYVANIQISTGLLMGDSIEFEEQLVRKFYEAYRWGAIILIDDSDLCLAKRFPHEMDRSLLVAVLLKVLKHHYVTCFITSNQALDTLDPAIVNQCLLKEKYKELSDHQKSVILKQGLKQLSKTRNVTPMGKEEVEKLLPYVRDGRDIENVLRSAAIMTSKFERPIGYQILEEYFQSNLAS